MLRSKLNLKGRLERAEKGQSLMEMAISFVILVFLISGLIDFGRLYFTYVALEDSAGEGALYLSINPTCPTATGSGIDVVACADPNNAYWRIQNAGGTTTNGTSGLVNWNTSGVVITPFIPGWPYPTVGETIKVTITYPFPLISPIVPQIAGINPFPLTVIATQTIIHCPDTGCPTA